MIGVHQVCGRWLRRHAFCARPALRLGAEAELFVHDATTGRPAPLDGDGPAILPFLHSFATARGWSTLISEKGAPRLCSPDGGSIALEPGGQVEYATRPHDSPRALHADLVATLAALDTHAGDHGLRLVAAGIDPVNGIDAAPLLLDAPRYRRMAAYFAGIGDAGARMMRQSAALQINVDADAPAEAWRTLNNAAPVLVAAFARSTHYAGAETGCASYRAETWRHVDPLRTGVLPEGPPSEVYAEFALRAPAMLLRHGLRALPFVEHRRLGVRSPEWREHLSTLFPEVRPKGHLEVRSIDAQPADSLAAPLLLVSALAWDAELRTAVNELVGPADPALLVTAGRHGMRDARLRRLVEDITSLALDRARRTGGDRYGELIERAQDWRTDNTG